MKKIFISIIAIVFIGCASAPVNHGDYSSPDVSTAKPAQIITGESVKDAAIETIKSPEFWLGVFGF